MANYCYYSMNVKGSKASCEEFLAIIRNTENTDERHFYRQYDPEYKFISKAESHAELLVDGYCAWSVYSAMLNSEDNSTTLQDESKRLDLDIEVFSKEPSMQFAEFYHFRNGVKLVDVCCDYNDIVWNPEDETLEELNELWGTNYSVSDFEDKGGYYELEIYETNK